MDWNAATAHLRAGGLVVYPTETFYALGCVSTVPAAVDAIFRVKGRDQGKTLPLIVADWTMVDSYLRLDEDMQTLARKFWPGPLSIIVPVSRSICPLARDAHGYAAVRMSPHPVARELCRMAGAPLVSTSANRSGQPAVFAPRELDSWITDQPNIIVVTAPPWPAGGLPSTLVELCGAQQVRILRHGTLSAEQILAAGYTITE